MKAWIVALVALAAVVGADPSNCSGFRMLQIPGIILKEGTRTKYYTRSVRRAVGPSGWPDVDFNDSSWLCGDLPVGQSENTSCVFDKPSVGTWTPHSNLFVRKEIYLTDVDLEFFKHIEARTVVTDKLAGLYVNGFKAKSHRLTIGCDGVVPVVYKLRDKSLFVIGKNVIAAQAMSFGFRPPFGAPAHFDLSITIVLHPMKIP